MVRLQAPRFFYQPRCPRKYLSTSRLMFCGLLTNMFLLIDCLRARCDGRLDAVFSSPGGCSTTVSSMRRPRSMNVMSETLHSTTHSFMQRATPTEGLPLMLLVSITELIRCRCFCFDDRERSRLGSRDVLVCLSVGRIWRLAGVTKSLEWKRTAS